MKDTKRRPNLKILKSKALDLYGKHQLPSYLLYKIIDIKVDTSIPYIQRLMNLTEEYLRVVGFYKKFPQKEAIANNEIKSLLEKGECK